MRIVETLSNSKEPQMALMYSSNPLFFEVSEGSLKSRLGKPFWRSLLRHIMYRALKMGSLYTTIQSWKQKSVTRSEILQTS
jgi:hypothetical protein